MLGVEYYREPTDPRISYEIVKDPARISLVRTWKNNRPPDIHRVKEVVDHLRDTNIMDGQILLAIIDGECVCYDGAHRLEASKLYFPIGGIQVRIIKDSTNEEIKQEFLRINKNVPVPELYFSDDDISMRLTKIISSVVKSLSENYKAFLSTSRRPKRPNFNRDTLVEELGDIVKTHIRSENIMNLTEDKIGEWLQNTNNTIRANHYQKNPRIKASSKILSKCETHKLYLFAGEWKNVLTSIIVSSYNKEG